MSGANELAAHSRPPVNGLDTLQSVTTLVRLLAGQQVRLLGTQNSGGGTLTTSVFSGRSAALSLTWVAP